MADIVPAPAAAAANLGFLTVVEHDLHGLFGGYLLLNSAGRPLEFHCTAPIKPSRAQQILYGPTLASYLYGEVIGAALVRESKQAAAVVLVDLPALMALRPYIDVPVAMVSSPENGVVSGTWLELAVHDNRLQVSPRFAADRDVIAVRLAVIDDLFDLAEPFGRIREAIDEAGRGSVRAA